MSQTIRQRRAIASCLGMTLAQLMGKRAVRDGMAAYVNSECEIRIRPRLFCDPDLPDNYQTQPRLIR